MPAITTPCCSTAPSRRMAGCAHHVRSIFGRPRFRIVLLLLGWTLATGAHWDAIQVVAWAQMLARNVQGQPLGAALATTFSPEGMCGVCHAVQAAKHQQEDSPLLGAHAADKAPLLIPSLRAVRVEDPMVAGPLAHSETPLPPSSRAAPPVPPPRMGLVTG